MRKTGYLLIVVTVGLFFIDRFSHVLSDILGKIICKDRYLQPVHGVVGDMSCGFSLDMYLAAGLLLLGLAGMLLIFTAKRNKRHR